MRYIAQLAKYGWFTSSPADIHGSVDIGVRSVTARATPKLVLALTVLLGAVSAYGASTAGIAGIDGHQHNPGQPGFVFEEQAQLGERPGMQRCALLLPGLDPFANASQLFNGNAAPGAFSFGNDLLRDYVVDVSGKPLLTSCKLLQSSFGGTGLFPLQLLPQPAMPVTNRFSVTTALDITIGSGGNVAHSQIDTKEFCRFHRGVFRKIDRTEQIELAFAVNQIGLPFDAVKPFFLVLAVNQRNNQASFRQRPQADLIESLETQDALVIRNRTSGLEDRAFRLVAGETLNGFADCPDGHLCRQPVSGSDFGVRQLVNRRLAVNLRLESKAGSESRRLVNPFHRGKQSPALFGVRQNLQLEREFHYYGVYHSLEREGAIPLPAKAGSLLAQNQ